MVQNIVERVGTLYSYISANGVVDFIILGLAVVSANFLAFIYYFDINALVFVDASTIAKHVLVITLHYAGSLAVISIVLLIFQNLMTSRGFLDAMGQAGPVEIKLGRLLPRAIRLSLWSIFEQRTLRTTLAILLFCVIYIGVVNSLILLLVTSFLLISICYLALRFLGESDDVDETKSVELFGGAIKMQVPSIELTDDVKKQTGSYLLTKVGVVLLYLGLSVGLGRANYIEEQTRVELEGDIYNVIVTSASSGLIFYNLDRKVVFFKPWSKIDTLELPIESQRSINTL